MQVSEKAFADAWLSFCDESLSEESAQSEAIHSWADVAAKIILQSDFLDRHPELIDVIRAHPANVARSALDEGFAMLVDRAKRKVDDEYRKELGVLQQRYCEQARELCQVEARILELKRILGA